MSEQQEELRERAIQAIRQHNNYRGKPLGELPRWLDVLVKQDQFQQHVKELKSDNALAAYALEQVKFVSAKGGSAWRFRGEEKEGKEKKTKGKEAKGRGKGAEVGSWAELKLGQREWGFE